MVVVAAASRGDVSSIIRFRFNGKLKSFARRDGEKRKRKRKRKRKKREKRCTRS